MKCKHKLKDGHCDAAKTTPIPTDKPFIPTFVDVRCPYGGDVQECLDAFKDFSLNNCDKEGWCDWKSHILGLYAGYPMYRELDEKQNESVKKPR